jgi:hypothetical protein
VERALENERASTGRVHRLSPWRKAFAARPSLRWAWIPAAAVTAFLVLSVILPRPVTDPSDGVPQPSEHVADIAAPEPTAPVPASSETGSDLGENGVRYVFSVKAKEAREVCLAGDFNQWRVCEAPMQRIEGDIWSVTIDLPHGRHEYMFVIDGRWVTDPDAMGYASDGFGNRNAVVVV